MEFYAVTETCQECDLTFQWEPDCDLDGDRFVPCARICEPCRLERKLRKLDIARRRLLGLGHA